VEFRTIWTCEALRQAACACALDSNQMHKCAEQRKAPAAAAELGPASLLAAMHTPRLGRWWKAPSSTVSLAPLLSSSGAPWRLCFQVRGLHPGRGAPSGKESTKRAPPSGFLAPNRTRPGFEDPRALGVRAGAQYENPESGGSISTFVSTAYSWCVWQYHNTAHYLSSLSGLVESLERS